MKKRLKFAQFISSARANQRKAFTPEPSKPEYFRVFARDPLQFFQAPLFCLPLTLKASSGVPFFDYQNF